MIKSNSFFNKINEIESKITFLGTIREIFNTVTFNLKKSFLKSIFAFLVNLNIYFYVKIFFNNAFINFFRYVVEFDFLGKDSIRYYNQVPVEKAVFKNVKLFMENKEPGDDLFDRLDVCFLNKYTVESKKKKGTKENILLKHTYILIFKIFFYL